MRSYWQSAVARTSALSLCGPGSVRDTIPQSSYAFVMRKDSRIERDRKHHDESLESPAPESQADGSPSDAAQKGGERSPENSTAAAKTADQEMDEMRRSVEEHRDRYLRLAAEFDNFRKRTLRERQETWARAQAELVSQMLDSLDDLGRVTALDPAAIEAAAVIEGVAMVERKLFKSLATAGLEVLNPVDETFNPELHEAVSTMPALSPEDDSMVAMVYQQGYVFKGQLIRPARVVVKQWNG